MCEPKKGTPATIKVVPTVIKAESLMKEPEEEPEEE